MITFIFVCISMIFGFVNLVILYYIGRFIVRFQERQDMILADLLNLPTVMPSENAMLPEQKTWDQKYEDDLEAIQRRLRVSSGLSDLPEPGLSWGQPPAPNPQSDLTIEDR